MLFDISDVIKAYVRLRSSMSFMLTVESKLSGAVDTRCIMFYCDIFTFDVHITLWPHQYS